MSCYPRIILNICDINVKIAESADPVYLYVKKGITPICRHELTPISGDIFLTDTEILDFGNEGIVYKLRLRTETNEPIPFIYYDCEGAQLESEEIRLEFINCDEPNTHLNEAC